MKKIILVYLLLVSFLFATPDKEEILSDPFAFSEYNQCFIVKASKHGEPFGYYFKSFSEVLWFCKEFKLNTVYVRDCDGIVKWKKLERKK